MLKFLKGFAIFSAIFTTLVIMSLIKIEPPQAIIELSGTINPINQKETTVFLPDTDYPERESEEAPSDFDEYSWDQWISLTEWESDPEPQQVYADDRVPHFVQTQQPDYRDVTVSWDSPDGIHSYTYTVHIDRHMYEYYHSLPRYNNFVDFKNYLDDENNRKILASIAESFVAFGKENGLTQYDIVLEIISFVQAIPYAYDIDSTGFDEFQKYPLETLYDFEGDCEDSSFLLAGLLRELDFGTCLLLLPGHLAVGIKGGEGASGKYFEFQGDRYYYIETTNPDWSIGDMPDDLLNEEAKILKIH